MAMHPVFLKARRVIERPRATFACMILLVYELFAYCVCVCVCLYVCMCVPICVVMWW